MKISQEIRDVAAERDEKSEEFIEGGKRFIAR
jgi:hypothetical protein